MRKLLWLMTLGMTGFAGAQATCGGKPGLPATAAGLYQGKLAGLPVTVQLGKEYRYYFYDSKGLDMPLRASQNGNKIILQETAVRDDQENPRACFTLTLSGNTLKGSWTPWGKKTAQPVTLTRIDVNRVPLKLNSTPALLKLRRDDPASFLKINHPWVKAANGSSVREPLSGFSYLRIPGGSTALNNALQDRQLGHAIDVLTCQADAEEVGRAYDLTVTVQGTFQTPKLLSFQENIFYDCGGAHPSTGTVGVILDRLTGEKVDPSEIWYSLDSKKQHELYLQALKADPRSAECRDVLTTERESPEYTVNLTKTGLQLTPTDLPHVVANCAWPLVISYATLKGEADTMSPYYADFYR